MVEIVQINIFLHFTVEKRGPSLYFRDYLLIVIVYRQEL